MGKQCASVVFLYSLLRHGNLWDGEVPLDLGLVDPVDGDPGEVATDYHGPDRVALVHREAETARGLPQNYLK